MRKKLGICSIAMMFLSAPLHAAEMDGIKILQPMAAAPTFMESGDYSGSLYIPSTLDTVLWGYLPNRDTKAVASIESGGTVVFDTVSHEGILEDQGRDPLKHFYQHGYSKEYVLEDAIDIAASDIEHDFFNDGPHIVTGTVEVKGAKAGGCA